MVPSCPAGRLGTALAAEAERQGVIVAPGPVFAAEGGLDRFVRVPWTRRSDELAEAVRRLAAAWAIVDGASAASAARAIGRVMVRLIGPSEDEDAPIDAQARSTARTETASIAFSISSQRVRRDGRVDRERDQGVAALGVAGDLHAGDVHAGVAEDAADGADHARAGPRS